MAWRYRPELDGLRALAVAVIIFFHAQVAGWSSSFIALDLFFVLSGFLVTNVVMSEIDETGEFRLWRFYARRVRRLLPAAVLTITLVSALFVLTASQPERVEFVRHAQAALLYVANWQFLADQADYFAGDIWESPFMHFWSLSVEEQYYILFPLAVVAVFRFAPRGRDRTLLAVLTSFAAASLALQVYWAQVDATRAYFGTDARLFQLLFGAILALLIREYADTVTQWIRGVRWQGVGALLASGGLAGYLLLGSEIVELTASNRNIVATVFAGALTIGVYAAPDSVLGRLLALPIVVWIGQISYGIYLWHYPAIVTLQRLFDVRPVVIAAMAAILATALAGLSHRLVESPIRRGRFLNGYDRKVVAGGAIASLTCALVVVPPMLNRDRPPALAANESADAVASQTLGDEKQVERLLEKPVPDLDLVSLSNDKGSLGPVCSLENAAECAPEDSDTLHVVLVGDSHARTYRAGLLRAAEEYGFHLSASIVPSCPWQHDVYNAASRGSLRERCLDARERFYTEALPKMEPDLVLMAGLPRSEGWQGRLRDYDGNELDLPGDLALATEETFELIKKAGANAVVFESFFGTAGWDVDGWDPLACLASAKTLSDCVVTPPLDRPTADGFYQTYAELDDQVATIDVKPLVCPHAPICLPVLHGRAVWRNENHLSTPLARYLGLEIWSLVEETGLVE